MTCPFCGSALSSQALICPFCKVELPSSELIPTFRVILERDRSLLEPGNRKKLNALAEKEYLLKQKLIAEAKERHFAEERQKRREAAERERVRREESEKARALQNAKYLALYKKFRWPGLVFSVIVILGITVVIPAASNYARESKYRNSSVSACNYARESAQVLRQHLKTLNSLLDSGKSIGSYWKQENGRVIEPIIAEIEENYMNPSSKELKVRSEIHDFNSEITYDIGRFGYALSTYWDSADLAYFGPLLTESTNEFIEWCQQSNYEGE
jgi:hypothetical protein